MIIDHVFITIGMFSTIVGLFLGARWLLHHRPHHHSTADLTVQRLSEIIVALASVNEGLRRPNPEMAVQSGLLLDIRNAMKDQVERTVVLQAELHGVSIAIMEAAKATSPMLEWLQEIRHELASRKQFDEALEQWKRWPFKPSTSKGYSTRISISKA
jgi:hypothetical protein